MPDTTPERTDEIPMGPVNQLSVLSALGNKQPIIALLAVFAMAGGGGTLGSMYVAPLVDDALEAHERDERAHQIDRLEERLERVERKIDEQGVGLAEVKAGVATAVKILQGP